MFNPTPLPEETLPAGITRIVTIEGITEYRLDNGLQVLLLPDSSKKTITVNINYLVGSRHEDYGETGMAHLLEHLMFKSSTRHPQIMQELTDHGARPNGTTWLDRTHYYETFSATDENLEWALDLEADRMVNANLDADDLEREKGVVGNEWMSGENNPDRILLQRVLSSAFLWHNYANSTIGALSDIQGYPVDRIRAFYEKYYQPDNAVLMIAGDITTDRALELVAEKFGVIPRPTRVLSALYTREPTQDGERTVDLRRSGDVGELAVVYHVPDGGNPDAAPLDILCRILGDTPSGRIYKALVETRIASSGYGYHFSLHDPGIALFAATVPDANNVPEARRVLLETIQATTTDAGAPTEEEVERAKNQLIKQFDLTMNSSERVGMGITTYVAMGDWRLLFLRRDRLKAVTVADVRRVAAAYLKTSNRTVGTFLPTADADRAEIPVTTGLQAELDAYAGREALVEGEVFDASPENIERRVIRTTIGGLKLSLLPKRTRGGTVYATINLHLGSLETLKGRRTAGTMVGSMLQRGTRKRSRQDLRDAFDRLQASVSVGGGPTEVSAHIETVGENLPEVLALVGEILRQPIFPEAEFETLRQERIAQLQENRSDPQFVAFVAAARYLLPYEPDDVRYSPNAEEAIPLLEAITLEEVKSFYADFYGASSGECAFVGDFDADGIAAQIASIFGDWINPTPYARVPRPLPPLPGTFVTYPTPDKSNAVAVANLAMPIRDDNPEYPALVIGDDILGGGFLSSRLATRIRQQEGLSYGIGSRLSGASFEENSTLNLYGIFSPANAEKFKAAMFEEVERLLTGGVTDSEVTAAIEAYLQGESVSRAEDRELVNRLTARDYTGRTMAYDSGLYAAIAALTPDAVNAALRKYLTPSRIGYFQAGDFED